MNDHTRDGRHLAAGRGTDADSVLGAGQPLHREALLRQARAFADTLAPGAAARDRQGGRPSAEIDLLKDSGLLEAMVPQAWGGRGHPWSDVLAVVREFARVDGSIAHLYGYHFLVMNMPVLAGQLAQAQALQRASVRHRWLWGNAVSSRDPTLTGRESGAGYVLDGFRPFATGSHVADMLYIGWEDEGGAGKRFAAIPASREGVEIGDDWDGFGQTQTGSGTVRFHGVRVRPEELIDMGPARGKPVSTLLPQMSQSVLSSVFIGSALGAIAEARGYAMMKSRPWLDSGVASHHEDPWVQRVFGDLWIRTEAARLLTEQADRALDALWDAGQELTESFRAEQARTIAAANVLAGEVALHVTSTVFEVMGARSATRSNGFDRFWRNVRVHTLHNPAEYKTRHVGTWVLTGRYPGPSLYV
ncbi:acyl-CoA dehydrogenase family protein [Acidovorax sp. NCPPB 3859]|nr:MULTISPECIES: acyl-CoA dehydrogenase family protein [unclassified Acidovorax]MDA8450658.1 acyl-CoA dehydrogenase family protein [Acidovorax sp. GBBC 3297]MDA8459975.1 acyl-CoA dehydrogenase family protein [Acidovorax sp. GBBC 3333]MDA8465011.1 acyl-CoA dehydrogenase family protein [Acidovorax sp. GBBC 3332]MDA8470173.1 acyl-CoA dehydrogenase family protein [Acidovorax sp. GBBC 3299]WCM77126.1 acyl-CoA dehydrogenase family protein [Acidovorax sp. GBBC 712]